MTDSEKRMILFLIEEGGADLCKKCIHLGKPTCGRYVTPEDYSAECDEDYCINGMIKFFEEQKERDKEKEIEEMAKELHCATNESFVSCRKIARILVERRGYGIVKNAVKEFAERLKALFDPNDDCEGATTQAMIIGFFEELYGEEN